MNRPRPIRAVMFAVVFSGAAILGPRIGDAITQSDAFGWQVLPWALIALCWAGLALWMRRARRAR